MKKSGPYSLCVNWGRSLSLVLMMALLLSQLPGAQAANDPPRAHPSLLKMARDHPNDTIRVIVQKDMRQKNAPGDEPEQALEKTGGKVIKKLDLINGFSAELSGKDLEKLAKHTKSLWVSFDAPLFSTLVTSMWTCSPAPASGSDGTELDERLAGSGRSRWARRRQCESRQQFALRIAELLLANRQEFYKH
jgi:hypothetical protein